jgi:hypothetical protein
MATHSKAANRIRRELQKQLDAVGRATGQAMVWTPEEQAVIDLICDAYDRKTALEQRLSAAEDDKTVAKLSGEIRLTEGHAARLLKQIRIPTPKAAGAESRQTRSARRAANARWSKAAG